MKFLKTNIPELFFILSIFYYWTLTSSIINWYAISLLAIVGILLASKKNWLGIVLGVLLILINCFLVLALISEFLEFEVFNSKAKALIIVGTLYLGSNLFFSTWLTLKYVKAHNKKFLTSTAYNAQR